MVSPYPTCFTRVLYKTGPDKSIEKYKNMNKKFWN